LRLALLMAGGLLAACAAMAAVELSADAMRDAEDTLKSLDSNVSLKVGPKALEEARELARFFQAVEGHYTAKADAQMGVKFAKLSREHAEKAVKALEAKDFDAAFEAVDDLQRSCKRCHEVYKKPK
jgi:hypothetical protein